jgi:hypothetical protein
MTKADFINTLRVERAKLDSWLAALTPQHLTRQDSPEAWSIKDHLAHLTYWEQYMLQRVRQALLGEAPKWVSDQEETEINARVFERNRSRPLANVLAAMHRSLADTLELVESLSEDDLTDPNRFTWMKGQPLWQYIANEGYAEHYQDHLKAFGLRE